MVRMQPLYILEKNTYIIDITNGETMHTILPGEQKYGASNGRKYYNVECYNNNIIEIINNKNQ